MNWNTGKPGCQPGSKKCNYLSLGPQRTHWAMLWKAEEHRERNEGNQAQYHWSNNALCLFWARPKSFLPLTVAIESPRWSMAVGWRTGASIAELGNVSPSHLSLYFPQVSWTDFSLMLNVPLSLCHALLIPTCTCGVLSLIALNSGGAALFHSHLVFMMRTKFLFMMSILLVFQIELFSATKDITVLQNHKSLYHDSSYKTFAKSVHSILTHRCL